MTNTITRQRIALNTYDPPDGTVEYSQGREDGTLDCSSYVARCLELAEPDTWSTVNLPQVCTRIEPHELQRGDLIGLMGAGTAGDAGHVMVFLGHGVDGLYIAEMAPELGPTHRFIPAVPDGYDCWTFGGIVSARTDEIIAAVNAGMDHLDDGTVVCEVVWQQRAEAFQAMVLRRLDELARAVAELAAGAAGPRPAVADHTHDPGPVTRPTLPT